MRLGNTADAIVERKADGVIHIRAGQPLGAYHGKLSEPLERWASEVPARVFLAQRGAGDRWRELSYAEVLDSVKRIGAALLRRGLSAERPIAILSGNDIDHALLALAAMYVGIPYAPISPAYSLMSAALRPIARDHAAADTGLVFASDGLAFGRALYAAVPDEIELVVTRNPLATVRRHCLPTCSVRKTQPEFRQAHAAVTPDTIAKFLFTSGSTGTPKGVINTQRMLCSNQAMLPRLLLRRRRPPVVVDWLPWSHTFGGNHNFNMVLVNGGTLYIDDGKPTPTGRARPHANLREIAPTIYFNVPNGFEVMVPHFRADETLRRTFFRRLKMLFYAGAGLTQTIWDELDAACDRDRRRAHHLPLGLGSTETSPLALASTCDFDRAGRHRPAGAGRRAQAGAERGQAGGAAARPERHARLLAAGGADARSLRRRGLLQHRRRAEVRRPDDPAKGFLFDGRIAEDFKLATGTWVSVGPLRARFVDPFAPFVRDVVFAGPDRDDLAALVFPDIEACRSLLRARRGDDAGRVLRRERCARHFPP